MQPETLAKIRRQQGAKRSHTWHCGEHICEFLTKYPQYEDIIAADLDNPGTTLKQLEAAIATAARRNGGGIGGEDADNVLRQFFGLPEDGGEAVQTAAPEAPSFGFSGGLF